ncbi:MFS transporter [Silvanigrella paludirubra]|uniref:MFS transporter n=1 Tax=Silvanigrella paludirubra TaxID=2499159 RepID=A0A6N6VZT6_9BACT|nr:MFS transporter [Silvanigrella paludirubra]KAB8040812.1 MFS transporter [Silvanigrella paludirubra]
MKQTTKVMIVVTLALFTDGLLYGLIIPLLPYSPAKLSEDWMYEILSASYALGVIISTPITGYLSDRIGRRYPMIMGVLIQAFAILIFSNTTHFSFLLVAKLAQGIAASTTWTSGLALITDHFTDKRAQMLGYALLGNTIGLVIGPLLGGFLFEKFNFQFPFIIAACFMLMDIFLRLNWIENIRSNITVSLKELYYLVKDKTVLVTSAIIFMGSWCWCVLEPLFPLYLKNDSLATSTQIGALFTISCLIYGISCPLIGYITDRFGSWKIMIFGLFLLSLTIPLLCLSKNLFKAGLALTLVNIAYGFALNPTLSELSTVADRRKVGAYATTYAIYNVSYSLGMFGSNLTNGLLAHFFSISTTFLLVGVALFLCIFIFLFSNASIRTVKDH